MTGQVQSNSFKSTTILLLLILLLKYPVLSADQPAHELYFNESKINRSVMLYEHRIAIGHPLELECHQHEGGLASLETATWLINGQRVSPTGQFVSGEWDSRGTLSVSEFMVRPITLWCQVVSPSTFTKYYGHVLRFIGRPVYHHIIGLYANISYNITTRPRLQACREIDPACDCFVPTHKSGLQPLKESTFSAKVPRLSTVDRWKNELREKMYENVWQSCIHRSESCLGVVQYDRQCLINTKDIESTYEDLYMEFGLFFAIERKAVGPVDLQNINTEIEDSLKKYFEYPHIFDPSLKKNSGIVSRTLSYCIGIPGQLDLETTICHPCAAGSYKHTQLTSPPLPTAWSYTRENIHPDFDTFILKKDKNSQDGLRDIWYPFLNNPGSPKNGYVYAYPAPNDEIGSSECLPCPFNQFAEEMGRPECITCPVAHRRISGRESSRSSSDFGSDWVHVACSRMGRQNDLYIEWIERVFGSSLAQWVGQMSTFNRGLAMMGYFVAHIIVGMILATAAYFFIDVGQLLLDMSSDFRRLHIQLGQLAITSASLKHEQVKYANEEIKARRRVINKRQPT